MPINCLKKAIKIIFFIVIVFISMYSFAHSETALFPLEITNIKPAGTGNPAIPQSNRIFRAYPGLEYNIRAAVVGGVYPYIYSLSNAPDGMTINSSTGEISWTNPQSNTGEIKLSVTDSVKDTVSTTWKINVTTNGFLFVDSNYSGIETGTITQPYKNTKTLLNDTYNGDDDTSIVYFRGGEHTLFGPDPVSPARGVDLGYYNWPSIWIAYPNEHVVIMGGENNGELSHLRAKKGPLFFDGITFMNFIDYGIKANSGINYKTIRRCTFDGLKVSDAVNNNYGFIFTPHDGTGNYFVIQDNEFKNWNDCAAIGSLYYEHYMLIEGNNIHNLSRSVHGVTPIGIAPKYDTDFCTIRKNTVFMTEGTPIGHAYNSMFSNSDNVEICYNLFDNRNASTTYLHRWNADGWFKEGAQGKLYYHRNTAVGKAITVRNFGKPSWQYAGPFIFHRNIIISIDNQLQNYDQKVYLSDNLKGSIEDNIIDDTGNLTSEYSSYFGTHGYEVFNIRSQYIEQPNNLLISDTANRYLINAK